MGSLFDWITDWIKEGLIEAITGQYTGIFESVNNQVADVAGQIGQTPQGWNGGVFSMIQNLSETVVIPIAGIINNIIPKANEFPLSLISVYFFLAIFS